MSTSSIKKISVNAIFLYLRTGVSLILQLIAVRYLLKYLGEDGYGLYGLVGSIVAIVASLKGLLSSSVQRFFNIAIGENNKEAIKDIFNSALIIHLVLGLLLALMMGVLGIIMIPNLDIPPSYLNQAWLVLGFSSITTCIDILTVPYSAIIIAYEKFNIYAFLSIIDSCLKLVIVLLLILFPSFRVAIYAGLLFGVGLLMRTLYVIISKKHFHDLVEIRKVKNKEYFKKLGVFAGLTGMGSVSKAAKDAGLNFIINIFGGLVVNTARTISYQVLSAVSVLVWNVNFAFMPKIITLYGEKRMSEYEELIHKMTKFTFIINLSMAFSLSVLIYPILQLWLGTVPTYVPGFIVLILIYSIAKGFIDSISAIFSAEGRVLYFELILVFSTLVVLGLTWVILKVGYSIYWSFGILAGIEFIACLACCMLVRKHSTFNIMKLVHTTLLPSIVLILFFSLLGSAIQFFIPIHLNVFLVIGTFFILICFCGLISLRILIPKSDFIRLVGYCKSMLGGWNR